MFLSNSQFGNTSFPICASPPKSGIPPIQNDELNPHEPYKWDSVKIRDFLEAILEEIDKEDEEGRATLGFDNAAWNRIQITMSARTGDLLNKKQLTNKYDDLRNDWAAWYTLVNDRSITALGRDPVTGAITAPDHQWQRLTHRNERISKFRNKPLEHPELMERVFRKMTQVLKGVYTVGGQNSFFHVVEGSEGSSETENGYDQEEGGLDDADLLGFSFQSSGSEEGRPTLKQSASTGKKRKSCPVSKSERLSESLCDLISNMKSKRTEFVHKHMHMNEQFTATVEQMKILNGIPAFKDPDNKLAKFWAMRLLETNPMKVASFASLQTNKDRMGWLQSEHRIELIEFQKSGEPTNPRAPPMSFPLPPYDD